jgi:hypothetical protein
MTDKHIFDYDIKVNGDIDSTGLINGRNIASDGTTLDSHTSNVNNPHSVTKSQIGLNNVNNTKMNFIGSSQPSVNNDVNSGYSVGSIWTDTINSKTYICQDASIGVADWKFITSTTTDDIVEGSNLYYTDGRFDNRLDTKTTDNLVEGSNLYYTDTRYDTRLSTKTTNDIAEGSNLYYTDARTDSRITAQKGFANGLATLDNSGKVPASQLNLDSVSYQGTWDAGTNIPELSNGIGTKGHYYVVTVNGSTNINGITDWKSGDWVVYNGAKWEKVDNTESVSSVSGKQGAVTLVSADITDLSTSTITEGSKLYYTDTRFDTRFSLKNTNHLSEGSNLYYTETRVNTNTNVYQNTTHRSRTDNPHIITKTQIGLENVQNIKNNLNGTVEPTVTDDTNSGYSIGSVWVDSTNNKIYTCIDATSSTAVWKLTSTINTTDVSEGSNLYYTDARFDTRLGIKTTDNMTEGSNLYYTDARFDR